MLSDTFSEEQRNTYGAALSGLCRELTETDQELPVLTTTALDELVKKFPAPNMDDLEAKLEKLLAAIKRKSKYFGYLVELDYDKDYPLAYAQNGDELFAFINQLRAMGLLELKSEDSQTKFVSLSGEGWKQLSRLTKTIKQKQGFVAAWFDPSTDESISTIKQAIESCGFAPMCIKTEHFKETIMDKALGELQNSRFVVVDLTGSRPSVFFEAGYARALNIETIFVYKEDEAEKQKLEFYVKHYQCHKYNDMDELSEIIKNAISSRIKD